MYNETVSINFHPIKINRTLLLLYRYILSMMYLSLCGRRYIFIWLNIWARFAAQVVSILWCESRPGKTAAPFVGNCYPVLANIILRGFRDSSPGLLYPWWLMILGMPVGLNRSRNRQVFETLKSLFWKIILETKVFFANFGLVQL